MSRILKRGKGGGKKGGKRGGGSGEKNQRRYN